MSTATVDGDNGLGLVVGPRVNRIAMDKAEESGSGWVSVRNTKHFGIAGYYVLKALERDLIGSAMTNSTKLVAPLWGAERMLGTNPIAIGFPGKLDSFGATSRRPGYLNGETWKPRSEMRGGEFIQRIPQIFGVNQAPKAR
jgi:LDH2 family malate/lactate/ureidoglycolate dehydrogenase